MTTPKDIEAAEKLANELYDDGSLAIPLKIFDSAISRISQALAAAREEGVDTAIQAMSKQYNIEDTYMCCNGVDCGCHGSTEFQFLAHSILSDGRNLPTNAPEPEGEIDGWNYDMSQAPKSLKELPDGAMIILAHEAPNGAWWAKTGIWDETSNKFMPIGGSWKPTAFRLVTLPTKKGE